MKMIQFIRMLNTEEKCILLELRAKKKDQEFSEEKSFLQSILNYTDSIIYTPYHYDHQLTSIHLLLI